jgi:hypothetical protein
MVGEGVVAQSFVSYKLTWKNPGAGQQPLWNQNDQEIEIHEVDIYPDLLFTKAYALATYYKYTTADQVVNLLRAIDSVIDQKLAASTSKKTNEADSFDPPAVQPKYDPPAVQPKYEVPATIDKEVTQEEPAQADVETIKQVEKPSQEEPEKTEIAKPAYTVYVYAERLKLIDVEGKGSAISIKHRVSENLISSDPAEPANKTKISAKVVLESGGEVKFQYEDFDIKNIEPNSTLAQYNGMNLLTQILPSLEINFTVGEPAVSPTSKESDYLDELMKNVKNKDAQANIALVKKIKELEANQLQQSNTADKTERTSTKQSTKVTNK